MDVTASEARYSTDDLSPVTPMGKAERSEREEAALLPESSLAGFERPGRRTWESRFRRILTPLLLCLTLFSAVLALVGWTQYFRSLSGRRLASEINGLVPEFDVRPVVFNDDPLSTPDHKTEESANATHKYWVSFMPLGNGFLAVDHSADHLLPPPMIDNKTKAEFYSIAVFHQLHCLHSIMKNWNKLKGDLALMQRGELPPRDERAEASEHSKRRHIDHCFRYLRQTIVCCGDTALEGQNPRVPFPDTDGTGGVHLCKDIEQLKAWAQDRRMADWHSL